MLRSKASAIAKAQQVIQEQLDTVQAKIRNEEQRERDETDKLRDINKLLITMNEAKHKQLKYCDEASFKKLNSLQSNGDVPKVGKEILDYLVKFIKGDKEATWDQKEGAELFEKPEVFAKAARRADLTRFDLNYIGEVGQKVQQTEDGARGSILTELMKETAVAENLPFFPYYKLLYKMVHIANTLKNKASFERHLEACQKTMVQEQVKEKALLEQVATLDFHKQISAEVDRSEREEISALR